jgi:hypothetical protein
MPNSGCQMPDPGNYEASTIFLLFLMLESRVLFVPFIPYNDSKDQRIANSLLLK